VPVGKLNVAGDEQDDYKTGALRVLEEGCTITDTEWQSLHFVDTIKLTTYAPEIGCRGSPPPLTHYTPSSQMALNQAHMPAASVMLAVEVAVMTAMIHGGAAFLPSPNPGR